MAEAVISAVVDVTLTRIISILEEQIHLQWGFKDELQELRDSLIMTNAFLRDAETRQVDDAAVKVWLEQLRNIASMADDVLDELAYEDLRRKVETQMRKRVRNFFSISKNTILFRSNMPLTVKGINLSFEKINAKARDFGLQQRAQILPRLARGTQATHSVWDSSQLVGTREAEVSKIIDLLIESSTRQTFSIVSIVGMGGLGKTTLAKSVCNNEQTKNYFNKIIWVCVSERFDVQRILVEMFESLTGKTSDMKNKDSLIKMVKEELEEKTYLLVLDDVWEKDIKNWEDLRQSLLGINGNKRNRGSILVTSRTEDVALVRETPLENRYHPKLLIDDECWGIIRKRAFQNSSISPELEVIGREIGCKCAGVPLVATVIGGTMCNKWDIDEWVSLRNSSLWGSLEKNEGIVRVLRLSFDRLSSPALKQCFVYCSVFSKGFSIPKDQLIQLWMAEGFLQQSKGNSLAFEDIGNGYFNDLLSNSLLQDVEKDLYGCITSCKMHDLVYDLAESIRNSETGNTSYIQQQIAFDDRKLWHSLFSKSSLFHLMEDFKGLRVLSFCDAFIVSLPDSIGSLKHLRYFDISGTSISRLPKSITQLYHLQTLRLLSCFCLRKLPKGMKNLVSLRHFCFDRPWVVLKGVHGLTNLQTLQMFNVSRKRSCGIGELGSLCEIGGELTLLNLQNVRNKEEAEEAKLLNKKKLHKLIYEWQYERSEDCSNHGEVLEGLEPHSNLKSLTISNYFGVQFPSWLARKTDVGGPSACYQLINLVKLELSCCKNLKNLPTLGQYPKLKVLEIEGLSNVRCIGNEFYCDGNWCNSGDDKNNKAVSLFPALENFTLRDMNELEKWLILVELTIPVFPSLKELRIENCYKLSGVPMMSRFCSLEILAVENCKELSWIGDEDVEGDELFPSTLKILTIQNCGNLRSIPSVKSGISFLQELNVWNCENLCKIGERLLVSPCLREVWIVNCSNLICVPLNNGSQSPISTRLEMLKIQHCPNLTSISSLDGLSSLLELILKGCRGLTSLPSGLPTCTSLQYLYIEDCTNLMSIPEDSLGCLTCLKELRLGPFSKDLVEFPGLSSIHKLCSSLEDLKLIGWEKVSFLSQQLQHLTALTSLTIQNFHGVKALPEWLGNLSSLQYLRIKDCENLEHLPSKKAMERLSNLQKIYILNCSLLEGNPAELSKVTNIPIITSIMEYFEPWGFRKFRFG